MIRIKLADSLMWFPVGEGEGGAGVAADKRFTKSTAYSISTLTLQTHNCNAVTNEALQTLMSAGAW